MKERNLIYGIIESEKEAKDYKEILKEEYGLSDEKIKELTPCYLFRLSDFIRYKQFDADVIFYDKESNQIYHIRASEPCEAKKEDIVALANEELECEEI